MHIVTKRHLEEAMEAYKDAANKIEAWQAIVKMGRSLHSQSSTTLVFFRIPSQKK
jgi:mRNA-degrading endonuclease HigB of HigAB toxin-antitoxin module